MPLTSSFEQSRQPHSSTVQHTVRSSDATPSHSFGSQQRVLKSGFRPPPKETKPRERNVSVDKLVTGMSKMTLRVRDNGERNASSRIQRRHTLASNSSQKLAQPLVVEHRIQTYVPLNRSSVHQDLSRSENASVYVPTLDAHESLRVQFTTCEDQTAKFRAEIGPPSTSSEVKKESFESYDERRFRRMKDSYMSGKQFVLGGVMDANAIDEWDSALSHERETLPYVEIDAKLQELYMKWKFTRGAKMIKCSAGDSGYEFGSGLGRQRQGRRAPILAHVRQLLCGVSLRK